jgi:pimeloyl-ACP methyl ester carboxylesterase
MVRARHGVMVALVLAACGPATAPTAERSTIPSDRPAPTASATPTGGSFADAPCPDDVLRQVVARISCGYLTTLEMRGSASTRTVRLFVVRVEPPGEASPDPQIVTLDNLPGTPDYGGLAPGAQRVHRMVIVMDPRGTGHSEPNLDCPEVAAVATTLVGLRWRDPAHASTLRGAVRACHDRLSDQGIDLAAYDLAAEAADLEDLRRALGIQHWNAQAFGLGSRAAFELERLAPEAVRTLVTDSPALTTPGPLGAGPAALDLALSRLVALCNADAGCAKLEPDLAAAIDAAVARLDSAPLILKVDGTDAAVALGHPITVVIDGAALLRGIRAALIASGGGGSRIVAITVAAVLGGTLGPTDTIPLRLAADPGDCLGILPRCERLDFGALYSLACRDFQPETDQGQLERDIHDRAAYRELFMPGPFGPACDTWSVAPADPTAAVPIDTSIPTLVMRGWLDPFSAPPSAISSAVAGAGAVSFVEVPNASYNVQGYNECPRAIRNAWVDAPTRPPADLSCLSRIPTIDLAP